MKTGYKSVGESAGESVGENVGESAAFTMGDRNVCGGTRQTLANKPYLDHVIYVELQNQIKGG